MITQGKQFLPYAVGKKVYGAGRSYPNSGPTQDKLGYKERDKKHKARRAALLRRLKSRQSGNFMSPDIGRKL